MKFRTPKTETAKGEAGFTLVETSISMVVLMVAALACSSLFVFSINNNVGGSERALSMAVAQQQLEQIRSVNYEDSTLNTGTTNLTV
ncbi:MAG TPA: prepilin-type N-terminal cleavage/methylation domain-containing protein, partial [Pyrinomonadaceae bacterium]|nr:prepilin-type N-terminal cleavage/methylation domain-containing protein [Pyrinomonadaceae bacterium]